MFMANAIAIASSWLLHFWRRREFLVHEEIQNARIRVEMQLAERKKAEGALRESEALLSVFLERLPVGVGLFDPQGRWLVSNSLLRNLMSESIPSRDPENSWRWRTWEANGRLIPQSEWPGARALKGETVTPGLDFLYTSDSGQDIWMRVSSVPFRNDAGEITGVITVIKDIDKQKRAEEALKKSEKSLAEAQRIAHLGNWEWDIATDKIYWSDEVYRIFGRSPQEFDATYMAFLSYIHPDDRIYVNKAVTGTLSGKPYSVDYRVIRASGEERVVHAQGEAIFGKENTPVRMLGTVQDITERKKAEEKIQRLADVVESSDDSILTLSLEGIITSWNKGSEQVYDYSAEEVLGKNFSMLEPANLKGEMKKLIERVKNNEKVRNYETLRLKKDGTLINVSVTLSPVFSLSGKLVAVSTIARDITERKRAEEALAKIDIARQKEIHHRIKNNLQVISSLLDLTAERFNNRECIQDSEVLKAFRESQDRVISMALIHEELYKGEGFETLNFSQYIKELAENLLRTYSVGDKDIILNMYLEENALFDMDTAVPLGIIVNELLSNSLKHAFPDIKEGEIRIELHKEENVECIKSTNEDCKSTNFVLTISDNGVGIPENFDMENLDTLGTQLVTSLVDQLDGELELKRENGTEFTVRFTVTEKDNQASAPATQQSIE